jgi:hypothetical protein
MADEVKTDQPPPGDPPPAPAPGPPPQPPPKAGRTLRLKVVSDGTQSGTHLADADTGEPVTVEGAHVHAEVGADPKRGGTAAVRLVLPEVPVDAAGAEAPFALLGATLGHPPPRAGATFAAPGPGAAAPVPQPEQDAAELRRRLSAPPPGQRG